VIVIGIGKIGIETDVVHASGSGRPQEGAVVVAHDDGCQGSQVEVPTDVAPEDVVGDPGGCGAGSSEPSVNHTGVVSKGIVGDEELRPVADDLGAAPSPIGAVADDQVVLDPGQTGVRSSEQPAGAGSAVITLEDVELDCDGSREPRAYADGKTSRPKG